MSDAQKDELLERFESDLEFLADTVQLYKEDSAQLNFQNLFINPSAVVGGVDKLKPF